MAELVRVIRLTHGRCLIREDGPCDGDATFHFPGRLALWQVGSPGKVVVIWDNASRQIARMVTGHAEELGIELAFLHGDRPDLKPIERL